jgi:hypothetical protein
MYCRQLDGIIDVQVALLSESAEVRGVGGGRLPRGTVSIGDDLSSMYAGSNG